MQAWNLVKVKNDESLHDGRAGTVVRVESKGDLRLVQVRLDEQGTKGEEGYLEAQTEPFADTELVLL
ncbi:hypothetical protein [Acidovorax delafieldii]|uniref:hypothetical protein n=1 Tax=Acidovorax delafieldii TaxID=47920 RepID=UPI003ED01DED